MAELQPNTVSTRQNFGTGNYKVIF